MTDQPKTDSENNTPDTLDKFQVLEKIASGGVGIVYKAKDTALAGKLVALKVLKTDTKDTDNLVRFQNEARILVRLSHPNIATAYDFGISKNGEPFMAIEFIDGVSLREVLSEKGRLSVEETLRIAVQVCDALGYAHSKGVVHRDIQPGNIILTTSDTGRQTVKIIDFGIAKAEEDSAHLTRHGQWIGSPLYISPEQCSNQEITIRSDMYSLGCVLYHCLVGTPPFRGDTAFDTIKLHVEHPPQPLNEAYPEGNFAPELCTIIERMLDKQAERRYDSMEKIGRRLGRILYGTSDASPIDNAPDAVQQEVVPQASEQKFASTKSVLLLAALFIPAIIFLGITLGDWLSRDTGTPITTAKHSASVEHLRELLKKGEVEVSLTECQLSDDDLREFEKYPKVHRLEVTGIDITDNGLKYLEGTDIGRLELNDTSVKTLEFLPNKETIGALFLRGTKVNDESMKILQKCPRLDNLDVAGTQVTMKGLQLLTSLPLKELNVTPMSTKEMDQLAQLFPFCIINRNESFTDRIKAETEVLLEKKRGSEAFSVCSYWRKIAHERNDYPFEVFCITGQAYIKDRMNRHEEADSYWKEAITLGEQKPCEKQMATTYSVYLRRLVIRDRMDEAVEIARKLIGKLEQLDINHYDRAALQLDTAMMLCEGKRPKAGIKIIEGTLDSLDKRFEEHRSHAPSTPWSPNDRFLHAQSEVILGEAFRYDGQLAHARQHVATGISELQGLQDKLSNHQFEITSYLSAAQIELLDKKLDKSLELNGTAEALLKKGRVATEVVAEVLGQRHEILLALGRTVEAKQVEFQLTRIKNELKERRPKTET
jgi:Serine/threonine protein kinase